MSTNDDFLSWDGKIENESGFTLLPEGAYTFTVLGWEKTNSNKTGAPMAVVTLGVDHEGAQAQFKDYLVLSRAAEWKLCAFFRAIGLKKSGEPFIMDWNKVEGRKGRAKVTVEGYTKQNGDKGESNKIGEYLEYENIPQPNDNTDIPF
jgi:hypothetical protein